MIPVGPFVRTAKDKNVPPDVIASLFTLGKPGDLAIASADAGPVLVKLARDPANFSCHYAPDGGPGENGNR